MVADATDTCLPANTVDAIMCIDALQLIPDKNGLLRGIARVLRPGGRAVITTWERRVSAPADLPPGYSIADAGALAGTAGLRVLAREEHDDWLEQEAALHQRVAAEHSDNAEPGLRLLADAARDQLPYPASVAGYCSSQLSNRHVSPPTVDAIIAAEASILGIARS